MADHAQQTQRPGIPSAAARGPTAAPVATPLAAFPSRPAGMVLLLAFALFATLPPFLLIHTRPGDDLLVGIARRAALLAYGLLVLQVVLAARFRFTDLALGLDSALRLHRAIGMLALLLLLVHPTLLLLTSHGDIPLRWDVLLGASALLLLAAGVLAAVLFRFLGMDFNRWRSIHKAMILVVLLGAAHGRALGESFQLSTGLRVWWIALLAIALGTFAWRNLLVQRWGLRHFRVAGVRAEARRTWTISLVLERGRPLRHLAGQFMFLNLLRADAPAEEHPFTISSPPNETGVITATVKESGDFTRTIGLTRPGDRALVEGPFGRFTLIHHAADRFLFISAGVGCTPFASMLRFLSDTGDPRPVLYLCANRSEDDVAFREELARLPRHMTVLHVLSQPGASWTGARGHLDQAALANLAGAWLEDAAVFLCGPPAFLSSTRGSLRNLGVPRARIHFERFTVP